MGHLDEWKVREGRERTGGKEKGRESTGGKEKRKRRGHMAHQRTYKRQFLVTEKIVIEVLINE